MWRSLVRERVGVADYSVIADPAGFADAVARLAAGSGPVAIDVERASGFRYSQRAYLVQAFRRNVGVVLFDPPRSVTSGRCKRPSATKSGSSMRPARTCRRCESWVSIQIASSTPNLRLGYSATTRSALPR